MSEATINLSGNKKSISKSDETNNLVSLNQTHICFDVEQLKNAKQEVQLRRCEGIQDDIAWRMRTNVPTRYLVVPSKGLIQNDKSITLTIELMGNKFHPNHKLTLQAIAMIDGCNERTIWNHQNAKNCNKVQVIRLKLSTVLINIEMSKYEEENFANSAKSLESLIENSSIDRLSDIKELEEMLNSVEEECNNVRKNTERAKRLKTILEQALNSRKLTLIELKRRMIKSNKKTKKLRKELEGKKTELRLLQNKQTNGLIYPTCRIC